MNIKIFGTMKTLSPLSHIGQSISTDSYLVQEPILQPNNTLEEVFCYSGNAWRGQLRDACSSYMLDLLGINDLSLDAFHLLFSGGKIGGEQKLDINYVKKLRSLVPIISVFGGGIGNQIVNGKMRVSNIYPICKEARTVLPKNMQNDCDLISYKDLTFEKSFSRKNDTKNYGLQKYLGIVPSETEKTNKKIVPQQMRMTSELLIPGVKMYSEIELLDVTELELGVIVSALHTFANSPHIGGQANKGHGKITIFYNLTDLNTNKPEKFVCIRDNDKILLSKKARIIKDKYDMFLTDTYLGDNKEYNLTELLSGC